MEGGQSITPMTFPEGANKWRKEIKFVAAGVKNLADAVKQAGDVAEVQDKGEFIANVMLAFRHLEDASMRLGKALQAADGGVSVYDKETTVGVE